MNFKNYVFCFYISFTLFEKKFIHDSSLTKIHIYTIHTCMIEEKSVMLIKKKKIYKMFAPLEKDEIMIYDSSQWINCVNHKILEKDKSLKKRNNSFGFTRSNQPLSLYILYPGHSWYLLVGAIICEIEGERIVYFFFAKL